MFQTMSLLLSPPSLPASQESDRFWDFSHLEFEHPVIEQSPSLVPPKRTDADEPKTYKIQSHSVEHNDNAPPPKRVKVDRTPGCPRKSKQIFSRCQNNVATNSNSTKVVTPSIIPKVPVPFILDSESDEEEETIKPLSPKQQQLETVVKQNDRDATRIAQLQESRRLRRDAIRRKALGLTSSPRRRSSETQRGLQPTTPNDDLPEMSFESFGLTDFFHTKAENRNGTNKTDNEISSANVNISPQEHNSFPDVEIEMDFDNLHEDKPLQSRPAQQSKPQSKPSVSFGDNGIDGSPNKTTATNVRDTYIRRDRPENNDQSQVLCQDGDKNDPIKSNKAYHINVSKDKPPLREEELGEYKNPKPSETKLPYSHTVSNDRNVIGTNHSDLQKRKAETKNPKIYQRTEIQLPAERGNPVQQAEIPDQAHLFNQDEPVKPSQKVSVSRNPEPITFRTDEGECLTAAPPSKVSAQQTARDERIQKLRERNEQNRQADQSINNDGELLEDLSTPGTQIQKVSDLSPAKDVIAQEAMRPAPVKIGDASISRPVSLNSYIGQSILSMLNEQKQNQQPRPKPLLNVTKPPEKALDSSSGAGAANKGTRATHNDKTSHGRRLGDIMQEDLELVKGRDENMQWPDVMEVFEKTSGKKRCQETLRKRCNQVKKILQEKDIAPGIIDDARSGDHEALKQLNIIVHRRDADLNFEAHRQSVSPIPSRQDRTVSPEIGQETQSKRSEILPLKPRLVPPKPSVAEKDFQTSDNSRSRDFTTRKPDDRPTTGGKTINEDFFMNLLAINSRLSRAQYNSDDEPEEQETMTDEDYCHFIYRIERREITVPELEDDIELDDVQWIEFGPSFEKLSLANARAVQEVLRIRSTGPLFADPDGEFDLNHAKDEDGLTILTINNKSAGIVQVRVVRSIRSFDEHVLPKSRDCLAPRTVYLVRFRITTTKLVEGDLFGESETTVEEGNLHNVACTVLELANEKAVRHFVELSFTSSSANLTRRQEEKQALIAYIMDGLEEDDIFHRTSGEGTNRAVAVWVEVGTLVGPRNL